MDEGVDVPVVLTRRSFLGTAAAGATSLGFLPLLRMLPPSTVQAAFAERGGPRFFTQHQWDVVVEATARLIPGPTDDPAETTPGAREAQVVSYIDRMLSAFDDDPPLIYTGGPWSDRAGGATNELAHFTPLSPWQADLWRKKIGELQDRYRTGLTELDAAAGGDFTTVAKDRMDAILVADTPSKFRKVLFQHAAEGMYSVPEYGGNAGLAGWQSIGFAGDVAPKGWTPDQVSNSDGPDPVPAGFEMPFPSAILKSSLPGVAAGRGGRALGGDR